MAYVRTCLSFVLSLQIVSLCGNAQSVAQKATVSYFNQFQRFGQAKKIDSAFYSAQQLALENTELLNMLLHDSFAQSFLPSAPPQVDTVFVKQLLQKLYTGNLPLQRSVYPLYKWIEIKNNIRDTAKTRQLLNGFMVAQERLGEEKGNRIDRYSFLIYDLLKQNPGYSALSDTLFNRTRRRIEHAVNGLYYQATDDPRHRGPRAYFRYLMAYVNLTKASEFLKQNKSAQAETFLKEASQFSPDDTDRQAKSDYFYETVFLLNGQEDFHEHYANFLLAKGDTTTAFQVLTELTLADPGRISLLKTYYPKIASSAIPFQDYWTKTLNAKLKPAETFSLTDLNGNVVDYEQYRGRWILIDFWGTWCVPCVQELPQFQKFYRELAKNNPKNIVVFTAAARDTEPRVRDFMAKEKYNFPVVMANDSFIKQFRVNEYPTKILITPQGNRMKIPSGTNWVERVRVYTEN